MAQLTEWRRRSAALSVLQILLLLSVFALVLVATVDAFVVVAAAGVLLLLEVMDIMFAQKALRLVPADYSAKAYARRPLRASDRRMVVIQLLGILVMYVLLAADFGVKSPQTEHWLGAVALAVAVLPGCLALGRVLRNNSWLAVSRIPGPGRGPSVQPDGFGAD